MTGQRIALAMALGLAVTSASQARVSCPDRVELRTCIGVAADATVRFCFEPETGCLGTGYVREVRPPSAPFTITGLRVQGALGTRPIDDGDLPLLLLPGESFLIDVSATVTRSGEQTKELEFLLANRVESGENGKVEGEVCEVDLRVRAPGCLPADQAGQCAEETCVDGACEPAAQETCDDGDACTTDDACSEGECTGTQIDCDDDVACTQDVCTSSGCLHQATDALCDSGQCSVATCRPDDPAADARGCISSEVDEGDACTDDGVPCTDDVCTSGTCLHFPVDTRCPGAASCTQAACAPADSEADAAGCVIGPAGSEGGVCAEDGDPCSDDRCRAGACEHRLVTQHVTCAPVENAFRRALALLALTRSLSVSMEVVGRTQLVGQGERLTAPLVRLGQELDGALAALSGRTTVPIFVSQLTGVPETPAQARARAALLLVGRMPLDARSFLKALAATRKQGLDRDQLHALMDQARALRRGVKRLKIELKRLRRSTIQFAK